ncbi:hypothetical protein KJ909_03765 [Patescibacteria group bacterium]|nr:hypothetical protein [Patescibacteria group bacterium]
MTLQQAAGYQNRKDIPPQRAAGEYQVKMEGRQELLDATEMKLDIMADWS